LLIVKLAFVPSVLGLDDRVFGVARGTLNGVGAGVVFHDYSSQSSVVRRQDVSGVKGVEFAKWDRGRVYILKNDW
jgi:hypothetical protein